MENIYLTPEHELLRDQVARFIAREVEPHALAWEEAGHTPREVLRKLGAAGLLGLMYEGEYGGADADALTNLVFAEALSQSTFGGFIITVLVHTDMASPHLHHAGTPAQKAKYMPGVTAGTTITAVAITEPGAGSDVAGIRTTAKRSADGSEWILNGTKLFITNGVLADLYFVAAKTGEGRHAMSMFIVEKGTPGFRVGRALDKAGWLSSDTAELVFEDCRIPAAQPARRGEPRLLLGDEELPDRAHRPRRDGGRPLHAGARAHARAGARPHAPSARRCSTSRWCASAWRCSMPRSRAARAFMYHCAWRVKEGQDVVQEVSMLKALTGELVNEVVSGCQQFHGGMGYMRGTPIERLWRDARVLAIGGGATEVMLDEVAKRY